MFVLIGAGIILESLKALTSNTEKISNTEKLDIKMRQKHVLE